MHDDPQPLAPRELAGSIADVCPLLLVGGVDVEEMGGGAGRPDVVRDGLGEGQRRLAVEVDTEDAHAQAAELPRRRGAKAAGRAEDEAPLPVERPPGVHGGAPISEACRGGNAPLGSARGRQRRPADGREPLVGRPGQGREGPTAGAPAWCIACCPCLYAPAYFSGFTASSTSRCRMASCRSGWWFEDCAGAQEQEFLLSEPGQTQNAVAENTPFIGSWIIP